MIPSVETRICATPSEKARSLDIYNEVFPRRRVSAERAEAWARASLGSIDLLVAIDGEDVGSAAAAIPVTQPDLILTLLGVLSQHRRRGAGKALYEEVSRWAAEQGLGVLEARAEGDDEESLAFAKRRGFVEAWRETGFELDPRDTKSDFTSPAGIEIVQLEDRPELAHAMYDVAIEAMPDIPAYEDWRAPGRERFIEANVYTPGAVHVLALGDGDVVGYATLNVRDDEASHSMTAVARAWRGRGIARALKAAQIAWAKEHELTRLKTTNERRNSPMIRVNESLGYREVPGRVGLHGPLASQALSPRT